MTPTFFAQLSAGCFLAVAATAIRLTGWKYLRLMAIVSLAGAFLSLLLVSRESGWSSDAHRLPAAVGLLAAIVVASVWLFVNAAQGEKVRESQRIWPTVAGLAAMAAAGILAMRPDAILASSAAVSATQADSAGVAPLFLAGTTVLGAMLLGIVTAAMLLGHRYLTDSEMPIAPLRRLTRLYIAVLAIRIVWVASALTPVWSDAFRPSSDYVWFWVTLTTRVGIGLLGAAVFAYMTWDCVRRRATQSATALFYLSMVFVFLGELAAQYMVRTEGLAM